MGIKPTEWIYRSNFYFLLVMYGNFDRVKICKNHEKYIDTSLYVRLEVNNDL